MAEMHLEKSQRLSTARNLKTQMANDNKTLLATEDTELKQITQCFDDRYAENDRMARGSHLVRRGVT